MEDYIPIPSFPSTQYTAGRNVAIIVPIVKDGKGLCAIVVRKRNGYKQNASEKYYFPGGKVRPGEDPVIAAERELDEETNQSCEKYEYITHIRHEDSHFKLWLLGLECSSRAFPRRFADKEITGLFVYPLSALFTANPEDSRLHRDHWEALKHALSHLAEVDVFSQYARSILLRDKETSELTYREGLLKPSRI